MEGTSRSVRSCFSRVNSRALLVVHEVLRCSVEPTCNRLLGWIQILPATNDLNADPAAPLLFVPVPTCQGWWVIWGVGNLEGWEYKGWGDI